MYAWCVMRACVCVYVCVCVCVCVCLPPKRFLDNYWSHHNQTWHGNCLWHGNASSVNYIDFWPSFKVAQMLIMNECLICSETKQRERTPLRLKVARPANSLPLPSVIFTRCEFPWRFTLKTFLWLGELVFGSGKFAFGRSRGGTFLADGRNFCSF